MKVVIICERSGNVRREFRKRGHEAYSCDIEPADDGGEHIQDDARNVVKYRWDLMIAHPECRRLCNSGVRWLAERNLWKDLEVAAAFFVEIMNADIPQKAIENPIPHKYARELIGRKYDQIIQPYEFGDPYTKKTCLWLFGLPPLMATLICEERKPACWLASLGPNRSRYRSITYPGIARAMAEQWG